VEEKIVGRGGRTRTPPSTSFSLLSIYTCVTCLLRRGDIGCICATRSAARRTFARTSISGTRFPCSCSLLNVISDGCVLLKILISFSSFRVLGVVVYRERELAVLLRHQVFFFFEFTVFLSVCAI
jgi:hypothetical protein